ncbi:unnamed protein product [Ostreobium quekettii]|uniref:Glucose-methanol-choline oxidoreductase N-terminal domain-containing protein n=1 Tax=Ostreobium quekettii TaxID=121088 RepID=A0A8S1JCQ8_9CHLO|nr:unnamed protein product [Ostreobium quekettii]|eukprot:evm.model.scf_689EXC.3 EVM.evm.TU.scf_689EXC.3   scf_689EXC:51106-60055(-)
MGALRPRSLRLGGPVPQRLAPTVHARSALLARSQLRPAARGRPVGALTVSGDASVGGKYDYIVVGGGTAGCILANRLTAAGDKRVLVLEAGPIDTSFNVTTPAGIARLFMSDLDWNLFSNKQEKAGQREIYLARGKLMGGSSCTNATLYLRGDASDYDEWGVAGWGAKEALEWFKKSEDNARGRSEHHGVGGVMSVEDPRYRNDLYDRFFGAAQDVGLPRNPDFNDWRFGQMGFGEFQVTQKRGVRADLYSRCLKPAMRRKNLQVEPNAVVTKVEVDKQNGELRVVGVTYAPNGKDGARVSVELAAGGEVLLSAGAVHSPHILMLSGIGPRASLQQAGVDLTIDLPAVGQHLQDHPAVLSAFRMKSEHADKAMTTKVYNKKGKVRKRTILNYLLRRRGPLTTTGCDRGAFVDTTGSGRADLQMRFPAGYALDPDGVGSYVKFAELTEKGEAWPPGITFQVIACRPKSRGSIGLKSKDPFEAPTLDPGFLTDEAGADRATLRAGLRLSRRMTTSRQLAPLLWYEGYPGPNVTSDDQLDEYISKTLHSANALVGSCRMGSPGNGSSVVGPDLAVHGVSGLRVVDASVMPVIPGGQTGAPTAMIAERAAHMILKGSSA